MTWLIVVLICTALYVFLRSRSGRKTNAPVGDLPGHGVYGVDIVGESNYQSALERVCGGRDEESARKKVKALLVLEDDNPHDGKAVRVDIDGETVGYLPRKEARQYRARLKEAGYKLRRKHPEIADAYKAPLRSNISLERTRGR